jgi:hypothetical protein
VWVKNTAGGDVFQVAPLAMNVDGLKKAIAPRMDPQEQAAIKIYDHQGQAMEHTSQGGKRRRGTPSDCDKPRRSPRLVLPSKKKMGLQIGFRCLFIRRLPSRTVVLVSFA